MGEATARFETSLLFQQAPGMMHSIQARQWHWVGRCQRHLGVHLCYLESTIETYSDIAVLLALSDLMSRPKKFGPLCNLKVSCILRALCRCSVLASPLELRVPRKMGT